MNTKHITALVAVGLLAGASITACGSDNDGTPGTGVDTTIVSGGSTDTTLPTTDMSSVPSTTGG